MKVHITNSSVSLRDKTIEIDEEFCKTYMIPQFKEGIIDVETESAYLIRSKLSEFSKGSWVSKDMITVLPDVKDSLDKWL